MRWRRHRGGLFWRVYLHGLLLLFVIAVTAGLLGWMLGPDPMWRDPEHGVPAYLAEELGTKLEAPEELQRELDQLHRVFQADIAVYRNDHTLVAAAGALSLPAAGEAPDRPHLAHRHRRVVWLVPLSASDAYVVVRSPRHGSHLRWLGMIGLVLLVLAAVSIPFARRIARPVEKLTDTVRLFGSGELGARSGLRNRGEVGELARAFDDMAERIELLLRSEKEMLANVSHELRTPLARIRVALELAGETEDAAALKSRLAGIGADLAELETLIDDTLTAARLDLARGTELPLRRDRLIWSFVIEQAIERFCELHAEHPIEATVADDLPEARGDSTLLRRMVDNLLDNAARYAEPDAGAVELEVTRQGDRVRIEVRDRGIGVSEQDLPRLFEPFFRGDTSRARVTGGVGMGLALCRRVVEAHQGEIGVALREGGGTVFWVMLPLSG